MLLLKIDDILLRIDEIQDTISSRPAPLHFPSSVLRFRNYSSFWMEEKLDVDPVNILPHPFSSLGENAGEADKKWPVRAQGSKHSCGPVLCKMKCLGERAAGPACISMESEPWPKTSAHSAQLCSPGLRANPFSDALR